MNEEELETYGIGYNDGVKHAELEMYEEMLATLSDILAESLDIHVAIKEVSNELVRRM